MRLACLVHPQRVDIKYQQEFAMPILRRARISTAAVLMLTVMPSLFLTDFAAAAVGSDAAASVTVRYHDLNLNSSEGIATLYGRIRGAANEVCRSLESRDLTLRSLRNECFNHAVANAVNAVHNPTLSAYHWERIRDWKHREIDSPTTVASR
jgi:UrcA family protein